MGNLNNALQELRAERNQLQSHVEKLDQAISVIESLNGTGTPQKVNQPIRTVSAPSRVISAASRRRMALAQQARWAKIRKESQPIAAAAKVTSSAPVKRTMSAAARKSLSAFQKARWQKIRAQQKNAA
jgi:hypothetical protein